MNENVADPAQSFLAGRGLEYPIAARPPLDDHAYNANAAPLSLPRFDGPELPLVGLCRAQTDALVTFISEATGPCIAVVRGRAGVGKTSLVGDAYRHLRGTRNFEGLWIDCRQLFSPPFFSTESLNLRHERLVIVLDNLDRLSHELLVDSWLPELWSAGAKIVAVCSDDVFLDIGRRLVPLPHAQSDLKKAHLTLEIEGFSDQEIRSFLSNSDAISDEDIDKYVSARTVCCLPLFCQMLSDIHNAGGETSDEVASFLSTSLKGEDFEVKLLQFWLKSRPPGVQRLFLCLLHLPFAGMTFDAILAVLKEDSALIASSLKLLVGRGLVNVSGGGRLPRQLYSAHSTIRARKNDLPFDPEVTIQWRAYYLEYLICRSIENKGALAPIFLIDCWVSGWASIFHSKAYAERDLQAYDTRFKRYASVIPSLLANINSYIDRVDDIEFGLGSTIEPDMHHGALIALGHLLRGRDYNAALVEVMWRATVNYDGWGRASALGICVDQWFRAAPVSQQGRLWPKSAGMLRKWFDNACNNHARGIAGWQRQRGEPGLDVMVALAGVARMDGLAEAVSLAGTARFRSSCAALSLPNLMLLLRLYDPASPLLIQKHQKMFRLILQDTVENLTMPGVIVFNYMLRHPAVLGADIEKLLTRICRQTPQQTEEHPLVLDLARYADSINFQAYVTQNVQNARVHF